MSFRFTGNGGFSSGATNFHYHTNILLEYPSTLYRWFYPTDNATNQDLILLQTATDYWWINLRGDLAGDPMRAVTFNSTTSTSTANPSVSNAVVFNQWNHVTANFVSNTSRFISVNGAARTQGTTNSNQGAPVNPDVIIGGYQGGGTRPFNGYIAHVAIWNDQIRDAENATLGRGASPLKTKPTRLMAYWPMVNPGQQYNTSSVRGRAYSLPLSGSIYARYSNWNPPVKFALPQQTKIALASAQNNAPIFYHQRQQQGMAA